MEDHVVVDVEIQKTIEETPGGWDATDKLGVAVAVVYEFKTDRFRVYGHTNEELLALRARLFEADRISGYNIWKFDFPVIWQIPGRQRVEELRGKTNDLLVRIWRGLGLNPEVFSSAHKGWGLDAVAKGTMGSVGKIAQGAIAPIWFQEGKWGPLVNYCVDDVTLERDLDAYMAGFFDGEGHITIKNDSRRKWGYYVEIGATNTVLAPLELLKKSYGGNVLPKSFTGRLGKKQCYIWKASGKDAHWALSRMLPWLRVKNKKARSGIIILHNRPLKIAGGQISKYQKMAITKAIKGLHIVEISSSA